MQSRTCISFFGYDAQGDAIGSGHKDAAALSIGMIGNNRTIDQIRRSIQIKAAGISACVVTRHHTVDELETAIVLSISAAQEQSAPLDGPISREAAVDDFPREGPGEIDPSSQVGYVPLERAAYHLNSRVLTIYRPAQRCACRFGLIAGQDQSISSPAASAR